jgi:hypothetical protein
VTAAPPPPASAARSTAELAVAQLLGPVLLAVQLVVVSRTLTTAEVGRWTLPAALLTGEAAVLELGLHLVLSRASLADGRSRARRWAVLVTASHAVVATTAAMAGASWAPLALTLLPAPALSAIAAVGRADMARRGRYRRLAVTELEAAFVGVAVTVATAASLGVWSFVAGALADRTLRRGEAQLVMLLYVLVFLAGNLDFALASRLLRLSELGVYFIAFNAVSVPAGRIGFAANRVIVSRPDAANRTGATRSTLSAICAVGFALGAACLLAAPLLPSVLGTRWSGAVEPMRAFGAVTAAALVAATARALAVARDLERGAVAAMVATVGLLAAAILVVQPDDPTSLARAVAASSCVAVVTWWFVLGVEQRRESTVPVALAAAGSAVALALAPVAPGAGATVLAALVVVVGRRERHLLPSLSARRSLP